MHKIWFKNFGQKNVKEAEAVLGSTLQLRPGLTLNKVALDWGQPKLFIWIIILLLWVEMACQILAS